MNREKEWYAIDLIPVKSFCGKGTKRYHKLLSKANQGAFTWAFKDNTSHYSNASQYSGAIDACKNIASALS